MTVFALIDCNNFFVSCERLFRPDLEGKPVVVLSSNDGCAVSRSNEAKALGIPMGAPAFKYQQLFKEQGVQVLSANFELYGDISQRLTRVLTSITPRTEVYSVDESFVELSHLEINDYKEWGGAIRERLRREVGVPVSIGIAHSKTLAKLARGHAKTDPELGNVLDLVEAQPRELEAYLSRTPINDIWGVGWRLTPRLRAEGLHSALDLAGCRPRYAQQLMGVHGRQLVAELNGIACHPVEPFGRIRQSIMHGRMFGEDTSRFIVVEAAIASLTARAAASLRAEGLLARSAVIHLSTNRHKPGYERLSRFVSLPTPTADTGQLTNALLESIAARFNPQTSYHRVNVLLHDLIDQQQLQIDLLDDLSLVQHASSRARLAAMDSLNARYGKGTVRFAAEDLSHAWQPKRQHRSPRYTSDWAELPRLG